MVSKSKGRKIYRTAQGKQIDLDMLIKRNELTPAVGNAKVNARGDELGPGGKIIRKREEIMQNYYSSLPEENPKKSSSREFVPPTSAVADAEAKELAEFDNEWVEDADGNFVKKGG
jgi:hypothetical protein